MGQTIVDDESEQTIGATVPTASAVEQRQSGRRFELHDATISLNDQTYRTAGRLLASMPRLGAYHRA